MSPARKKVAIVLGGTDDHIYLIKKLKIKNFYTILVDYLEHPPAGDTADLFLRENALDKEVVAGIARERQADMVIATCIDQALLPMAYVCELLHLPCHITYQQALNLTNKAYMKDIFARNNIPSSRFVIIENETQSEHFLADLKFPLVIKPSDANSSKGVSRVNNIAELQKAITSAFSISKSKKVIVEEYIDGIELSVDAIIRDHKAEILLVTRNHKSKRNTNNFTIVQNSFNANDYELYADELKKIAEQIAGAFELNNVPLLIQVLVKNDQILVIEFSSRIGGGSKHLFVNKLTGFDFLEYFVSIIEKKQYSFENKVFGHFLSNLASVNYIYSQPGVYKAIEGIDELLSSRCIDSFIYYKTLNSRITQSIASTDRIGGFIIVANDSDDHLSKCEQADSSLKVIESENGTDIMLHGLYSQII